MKFSVHVWIVSLAVLSLPAVASADDLYFDPYVEAGIGQFQLNTGSATTTVSGGFAVLGAEIHPYIAPEIRFGKASSGSVTGFSNVSLDWFASYLLRLQAPVNEDTILYGLGGATTMRSALTPTTGTKRSDTSTTFSFGVGIEYRPLDRLSVAAEWVRYGRAYKTATGRGLNVTGIAGLLKYSF